MRRWSDADQRRNALAVLRTPDRARALEPSSGIEGVGLGRYQLLASAIAGRTLDVTAGAPDESAWTDGFSIFIDPNAGARHQLTSISVQAALIGAGSFEQEVTAALARRPKLIRRYLAIEGHRALQVHEAVLPPTVRVIVNRDVARHPDSALTSLVLARSRDHVDDAPSVFGTIRPRQMRAVAAHARQGDAVKQHTPRRGAESELGELDDSDGEAGLVAAMF